VGGVVDELPLAAVTEKASSEVSADGVARAAPVADSMVSSLRLVLSPIGA
jgi:hypothetical protein